MRDAHEYARRNVSVFDNLVAAAAMAGELLDRPGRRRRTTWGATPEEVAGPWPGDDLVPDPTWSYTHAITVAAPRSAVWPWVVQIGRERGGFYSFQRLENLVGCDVTNAVAIVPEYQHLAVGDPMHLHPKAPPLRAAIVDPPTALVFASAPDGNAASTWAFHLTDVSDGGTRLVERGWYRAGPDRASRMSLGPAFLEPISFVMSRRMLRTIRDLAEAPPQA